MGDRLEDIGQGQQPGLGEGVVQGGDGDAADVDGPEPGQADGVILGPQLAGRILVDGQATIGQAAQFVADPFDGGDGREVDRVDIDGLEGDAGAGDGARRAAGHQAEAGESAEGQGASRRRHDWILSAATARQAICPSGPKSATAF